METPKTPESKTLAPEMEGKAKTLAMPESAMELAVVSPPRGSPGGDRNPFTAGDFVWGRIKGHNWWPGRVCNQSQPSDRPAKPYRSIPVSYFGEDVISWCNPSQLKPFAESFHQFAGSSRSKVFISALESALDEIGKCLEVQLVCFCVPEEERNELEKYFLMNPGVGNYSSVEFLRLVRNVAVDLSAVDHLEISRLRAWVVAYERGCSYADSNVRHQRKGIKELVDKIDLDVPPGDLLEDKEEEAVTVSSPNERSRRSKRSMAALVAEMDLDSVDVLNGDEEKTNRSVKSENDTIKDEYTGPGRRERKKSKYLSPPYTYLSAGFSKLLASVDISESKKPKSMRALATRSSSAIHKDEPEEHCEEEDGKTGPLPKFDNVSTTELLAEFRAAAINSLHLKKNRMARTVTDFFATHRSSMFSSGAEFVSYQKRVAESVSANMESVNKEAGNVENVNKKVVSVENVNDALGGSSKEGKKSEERKARKKAKANGESKARGESGHQAIEQSAKKEKIVRKRKMLKEGANAETPASLKVKLVTLSEDGNSVNMKEGANAENPANLKVKPVTLADQGNSLNTKEGAGAETPASFKVKPVTLPDEGNAVNKKGKRKAGNHEAQVDLECKPLNIVESDKKEMNPKNGEQVADRKSLDVNCGNSKATAMHKKKKKKKIKEEARVKFQVGLVNKLTNGSEEGKPEQERNNSEATWKVDSAALHLSFSQGISLPSRENLISEFSKYGPLIESEVEVLDESNSARVVFLKCTDAEKAFNDKAGAFVPPIATYRLHYLNGNPNYPPVVTPVPPVPRPPLPYIRKNLERMISRMHGAGPMENGAGTSEGQKPEATANLVGAMQGLLTKVNQMLGGPTAGTST